MCLPHSSPSMPAGESVDALSAPFVFSETLADTNSDVGFGPDSVQSSTGANSPLPVGSGVYADVCGEDATREDSAMSSKFRQLNDDSTSLLSSVLASSSRVSVEKPESCVATQGNWLLPENDNSEDTQSASEIGPSKMGAGLLNLGNTCFLNAILQCFTHTVPLVQGLRSSTHPVPCAGHTDGFCVICALRIMVERSLAASGRTLSPFKFVRNLNYFSSEFRRYQQEDAHEFMQCALDKLERRFLDLRKSDLNFEDDNLVEKVFGGRLISKLHCSSCDHTSDTFEPMIDMSLEIENVDSLPSALESFTKVENIDANFRCNSCKEEVSMEKQLMLDQTPSIAAFHLKRFKTDGGLVEKIDKHIEFPLELDLQPYTINQNNDVLLKYDLYAIVVHTGNFSTSGHYFCFVRTSPDTWHKLDDSMVTEVSEDSVLSQEAYILFYARQGTPWFSSIMESQTQCLDLNIIMSTSPKSVLDVGDSMSKSNPISLPKIERGVADESKECSEPQFDYYSQEKHEFVVTNDTKDATHCCGQLLSGSNQEESVDLKSSKDVDAQKLFRNKVTLDGRAMFDGNAHIENGSLDNNSNCQEVDFRDNAGFHSLTPPNSPTDDASDKFIISRYNLKRKNHPSCKTLPNSPSDDVSDKFNISRDNLKRENNPSCKRSSNEFSGDSEEVREAVKYLKRNRSRRGVLLKFVAPKQVWN